MKRLITGMAIAAVSMTCAAFDPDLKAIEDLTLVEKYPAGSLADDPVKAERALLDIDTATQYLNKLSDYSWRRCGENFFVNSCREDVRKAKIRQEKRLYAIEVEAQRVIREDRTRHAQRKQAERDAKAATPPKPIKPVQSRAPERDVGVVERLNERQEKVRERERQAHERAKQEEANRAAYEAKLRDHEERVKKREEALAKRAEKRQNTTE